MVRESFLKGCFSRTYIFLRHEVVVSVHGRFVNDTASYAFPVKGAMVRVSTVAAPDLIIIPVFCPTYTGIMALDGLAHIWHTTVANFDRASGKDLA